MPDRSRVMIVAVAATLVLMASVGETRPGLADTRTATVSSPSPEGLFRDPSFPEFQVSPPSGWSRVEALQRDQRVVVETAAAGTLSGRVVSADSRGLVVLVPNETMPRSIPRDDITAVSLRSRARGSKLGAIVGAGVGAFVGMVAAVNLAYKDCGGDCSDEKALIAVSLVGIPLAAGFLGYRAFPGAERVTVIYRRQASP